MNRERCWRFFIAISQGKVHLVFDPEVSDRRVHPEGRVSFRTLKSFRTEEHLERLFGERVFVREDFV